MASKKDFQEAIQTGQLGVVKEILKSHPDLIEGQTEQGAPFTLLAAYYRQSAIFNYLIEKKASLSLFEAAAAGKVEKVRAILQAEPQGLNAFSADGFTILALACYFNQEAVAEFLINQGADVNLASNNPMQVAPLHSAVAVQNVKLAGRLLEKGADVNKPQTAGVNALHSAAHRGQTEMIKLLLQYGADPALKTADGKTALDFAKADGHEAAAALLEI